VLIEGISELMRRLAMSSPDQDRQRNREIAENEANRQVIGNIRVSVWAIAVAVVAGLIVFGIAWAWLNR
jgi:Flp pilus assembly protein TadB